MKVMSGATTDVLLLTFKLWRNMPQSQTEMKRYLKQANLCTNSLHTVQVTSLSLFFHSLMTSPSLKQTKSACMCLYVWCKLATHWKSCYLPVYLGFSSVRGEAVREIEIGCERRITVQLILNGICISFTPHCKHPNSSHIPFNLLTHTRPSTSNRFLSIMT